MEWIIAKNNPPPKGQKNILCAGPDGGVYKPTLINVDEDGEYYAIVSGRKIWIYSYLVYPDAPEKVRKQRGKIKAATKRTRRCQKIEWPLNMLADIDTESFRGWIFLNDIPDDFNDRWNDVSKKITDRERMCVEAYYKDLHTLAEIAVAHGITRERVRQLIDKAKRKLNRPTLKAILLGDKNQEERNSIEKISKVSGLDEDIGYCDLNLSVRAFNALKRNGVNTKRDLLLLSEEQVAAFRNVGEKTSKEIAECQENIISKL